MHGKHGDLGICKCCWFALTLLQVVGLCELMETNPYFVLWVALFMCNADGTRGDKKRDVRRTG